MIGALLAVVGLLAGPPTFWVERDGLDLRATVDATSLADAALTRRLQSGLTTTLRLTLRLREYDDDDALAQRVFVAQARWDLWGEKLRVQLDGAPPTDYPSVEAFAEAFLKRVAVPLGARIPLDDTSYVLDVRVEVNPMTDETVARIRRWLLDPGRADGDPAGRTLFGTVVRLFENLKTGAAEQVLTAQAHPFRGDRLPLFGQEPR